MARKPGSTPQAMKSRAARTAMAMGSSSAVAQERPRVGLLAALRNLPKFSAEVRSEARKITWTSRRETWITSVMVAIMVVLAAVFFALVDAFWGWLIPAVLKLANAG